LINVYVYPDIDAAEADANALLSRGRGASAHVSKAVVDELEDIRDLGFAREIS